MRFARSTAAPALLRAGTKRRALGQSDLSPVGDAARADLRLERDDLGLAAGARQHRRVLRYRGPFLVFAVERLGDDYDAVIRLAVIERVGFVVDGIAEGIEILAVGERGCDAQLVLVAAF